MKTKQQLADEVLQFPDSFLEEYKDSMEGFLEDTALNKEIRNNLSAYSDLIKEFAEKLRVSDLDDDETKKSMRGLMDYLNILSMIFCESKTNEAEALQAKLDDMSDEDVEGEDLKEHMIQFMELSKDSISLQGTVVSFFTFTRMMFMKLLMLNHKDEAEDLKNMLEEMDEDDLAEAFDGVDLTEIDDPDDDLVIQFAEPYGEVETSKSNLSLFEKVMGTTYKELDEYLR